MKKGYKEIVLFVFVILLGIGIYYFYQHFDIAVFQNNASLNKVLAIIIIIFIALFVLYVINLITGRKEKKVLKYRDKLFGALVQNSDTIYMMYDKTNEHMIYISKNVEAVLGVKEVEHEKDNVSIIKDFFKNPIIKEQLRSWDGKSELVSTMISYRNPNYQHTRWVKFKIYPFQEKKVFYDVILISEATKEHEQQHLLVSQASDIKIREQQLNQITAMAYDIEMDVNIVTGECSTKNLKEEAYFGPNRFGDYKEQLKSIVHNYVHPNDHTNIMEVMSLEHLKEIASKKVFEPISVRYVLLDGITWLESTAFFTVSKGDTYATILTKNVTEDAEYMRRQNALLQNALKETKRANDAKSEFLATMSHEIRTPMNTIIGLSESALSLDMPKEVKEDLENINTASTDLLEIIDGILDIGKVESGILSLQEREYKVPKLFKDLAMLGKEQIGNKNIRFVLDIAPDIPLRLFGDSGKIRQIITNLIHNAVKFTEEGEIILSASCEKNKSIAKLNISVIDTGIGMEKEVLEHLFDDKKDKNSGMGLMIAKNLIDALNGEMVAESTDKKGSKFTVSIHQAIRSEEEIGDINDYQTTRKKVASFKATGAKVLVVDDDKLNLKVARKLLELYGIVVTCVSSGEECLELIRSGGYFDLILLDQMMPHMDGIETLHTLHKNGNFKTPVVVLTADAIVGMKEKYLKEGFDDYLAKPIRTEELNQLLEKFLKR